MRVRLAASFAYVLMLGLAACGGGDGDGGAAGEARAFDRTDSDVTVLPSLTGGFTASRAVTISNDDAGASQAVVSLVNVAGSIASSATSGGYQIQITLTADGDTEQEARDALATMSVAHRDAVGGATLYLDNEVRYAPYPGDAMRTATVTAALPSALAHRLAQRIASGAVSTSGLYGPEARLDTTSGAATLSGTWDAAAVNSVSGAVTVTGDIADLQASSVSGAVQATLACARDTRADLDGISAGVDVTVAQNVGSGFDLEGESTSGVVTIVVAGTMPVGEQSRNHAHFRSPNYASASPRIAIRARTTNGGIAIHE